MNIVKMTRHINISKATAAALMGILMSMPLIHSAQAEPRGHYDRGGHDRGWDAHAARAHRDWHGPHPYAVYAPPVVYAPPPVEESSGINLVLPLNFR